MTPDNESGKSKMRRLPPTIERRVIRMTEPSDTTCPTCKADLRTQPHDLEPHRKAIGLDRPIEEEAYRLTDADNRYIEKAMVRHPAGNRLPGAHRSK